MLYLNLSRFRKNKRSYKKKKILNNRLIIKDFFG